MYVASGRNEFSVKHENVAWCSHRPEEKEKGDRVPIRGIERGGEGRVNWERLERFVRAHPQLMVWHLSELHREITGHSKDRWWNQSALGYHFLPPTHTHTHKPMFLCLLVYEERWLSDDLHVKLARLWQWGVKSHILSYKTQWRLQMHGFTAVHKFTHEQQLSVEL